MFDNYFREESKILYLKNIFYKLENIEAKYAYLYMFLIFKKIFF